MAGWPSGLRRLAQVQFSLRGVGSNPTSAKIYIYIIFFEAGSEIRTRDPLLTRQMQ